MMKQHYATSPDDIHGAATALIEAMNYLELGASYDLFARTYEDIRDYILTGVCQDSFIAKFLVNESPEYNMFLYDVHETILDLLIDHAWQEAIDYQCELIVESIANMSDTDVWTVTCTYHDFDGDTYDVTWSVTCRYGDGLWELHYSLREYPLEFELEGIIERMGNITPLHQWGHYRKVRWQDEIPTEWY